MRQFGHKSQRWSGLYYCRHTNYRCAFRLYHVLFSTKPELSTEQLLAVDLSYCWLYPSKQAGDRFMLFARLDCVLFSHLQCSVEHVLTANLSACTVGAGILLITRSMNIITGPTNTRTEPGYNLNCTQRVVGWGERLNKSHWAIQIFTCVLTTQFADSVCSNYTICWPGRYSRCMQYNYLAVPLICMAAVV